MDLSGTGEACGRFGWYADRVDPALASIRLRMLQPLRTLQARGLAAGEYDPARNMTDYAALVFSKSLSLRGLALARNAKDAGVRVIYDLCDNVHASRAGARRERRLAVLDEFLALSDEVVFSTPALRDQFTSRAASLHHRSRVIPDALEDPATSGTTLHWARRWQLARHHRFLAAHPRALHCVWFGKSQGRLAGLHHLDRAVQELDRFSRHHPVTLTVISNRWTRYRAVSRGWPIPHHYLPWSLATFGAALRAHHVAVVPLVANGYTQGKSINRPATALMAGLGVVGDCIDSYAELKPFAEFDDWQRGLARYASMPAATDVRIRQAQSHLEANYGAERIADLWADLLCRAGTGRAGASREVA